MFDDGIPNWCHRKCSKLHVWCLNGKIYERKRKDDLWEGFQKEDFQREVQERDLDQVQVFEWPTCRSSSK